MNGGEISNCSTTGNIENGGEDIGGLVGEFGDCNIDFCYSSINFIGSIHTCGGLCGYGNGCIENSFAVGNIALEADSCDAGGLVGFSDFGLIIANCYATGNVVGGKTSKIGGLVGDLTNVSVTNSYATGNTTGGSFSFVGGLVGYNPPTNTNGVTNCYWNSDATQSIGGTSVTTKLGIGTNTGSSTPETSSQLKSNKFLSSLNDYVAKNKNLVSWRFVADSNNGYPILNGVGNVKDTSADKAAADKLASLQSTANSAVATYEALPIDTLDNAILAQNYDVSSANAAISAAVAAGADDTYTPRIQVKTNKIKDTISADKVVADKAVVKAMADKTTADKALIKAKTSVKKAVTPKDKKLANQALQEAIKNVATANKILLAKKAMASKAVITINHTKK